MSHLCMQKPEYFEIEHYVVSETIGNARLLHTPFVIVVNTTKSKRYILQHLSPWRQSPISYNIVNYNLDRMTQIQTMSTELNFRINEKLVFNRNLHQTIVQYIMLCFYNTAATRCIFCRLNCCLNHWNLGRIVPG